MRNRRNTRKRNVVLDTITNRNFIIIVSILLAVIIVAEGVIQIRKTGRRARKTDWRNLYSNRK